MSTPLLPDALWNCFVESDSTHAAVRTTSHQGWQTSLTRPCVSRRYSVCNAQRDSLGDAAARDGLRLRNELLAKAA